MAGSSGKIVLPGDEVAVVEEFEGGEGTYEERGKVYAAQSGRLELDTAGRVARVIPFNPPAFLRVGDLVYGTVEDIRGSMSEARVLAIHGRDRQVAGEIEASLHVSKISNAYVEDIRDAMRLGDIIRARVIQTDPSVQITTAEGNLGVVLALCSNCRGPAEKVGETEVYCPRCDRTERRKLAGDYGRLELSEPIAETPEPGGPRSERGERAERDRDRGRGRGGRRGGRDRGRGGRGRDRPDDRR